MGALCRSTNSTRSIDSSSRSWRTGRTHADRLPTDLHTLLQRFASEATMLEPGSAHLLCEELADQLEQEALRATTTHRRNVLLGAVKGFDAMSFPVAEQ